MTNQIPSFLPEIINRLKSIPGIKAIALGGSRARGNYNSMSDVDLGIYYSKHRETGFINEKLWFSRFNILNKPGF